MKVCVVNPNFYRSSGITITIKRIYQGVAKVGVLQYFVNCKYGDTIDDIGWIPKERYAEFQLMTKNPIMLGYHLRCFSEWLQVREIQVLHVHHRRLAAILRSAQVLHHCQVVYTANLTYPRNFIFGLLPFGVAVAITRSVAKNIQDTMRVKNMALISNPVNFPPRCPSLTNSLKRAVCIARLEPVKGHETLIRAWGELALRGHEYTLSLVGEGTLRKKLESLVDKLGISQLVEFKGFQAEVDTEIDKSSFAVLASELEGQGIATLECAARGRPSLLTDVDGSRDCLPPDRSLPNGIASGDVAALATALESWVTKTSEQLAEEGRRFYAYLKPQTSIESVAIKYADVYRGSIELRP